RDRWTSVGRPPVAGRVRGSCGLQVELGGRDAHGVARLADGALLVLVEVAVGTADDDADLDDGPCRVGLALQLRDGLDGLDLAEVVVGLELAGVVGEPLLQLARREDRQDVVAGDEARGLRLLVGGDRAVGGGDERADGHARVREVLVLELPDLGLRGRGHVGRSFLELVPQRHERCPLLGVCDGRVRRPSSSW
ncbi:hypothetical protein PSD17_31940, partial [Pseudonocardia sp. D17]